MAAGLLSFAMPVQAEMAPKDFQIIGRTLSLLSSRPAGRVNLAIIYAPDLPASKAEAEAITQILTGGLSVGNLTLLPIPLAIDRLGDGLNGTTAAFVTQGLTNHHETVAQAARRHRIPTITTDMACVRTGKCVLGLRTEPQVEILLNRAAAQEAQVSFASAFRLLISEI